MIVGPNAVIRAYSQRNYQGTELAFLADQRVSDLSDLNMGNTIESLKIMCGNPLTGMGGSGLLPTPRPGERSPRGMEAVPGAR